MLIAHACPLGHQIRSAHPGPQPTNWMFRRPVGLAFCKPSAGRSRSVFAYSACRRPVYRLAATNSDASDGDRRGSTRANVRKDRVPEALCNPPKSLLGQDRAITAGSEPKLERGYSVSPSLKQVRSADS